MTTKTETAAEQYARLKREQFEAFLEGSFTSASLKGVQLYEVKAPSGFVYKCRHLDGAFAANTGSMPMALSEALITKDAGELTDEEKAAKFEAMPDAEKRANVQATAQMVRYVCVSPRIIVGEVGDRRDAISADMLTMADFKCLSEWAVSGGGAAEGLKTFRKDGKRRRTR